LAAIVKTNVTRATPIVNSDHAHGCSKFHSRCWNTAYGSCCVFLWRGLAGRQPLRYLDPIVANAVESNENLEVDAAGPDTWSFRRYVELVAHACGIRRRIVCAPRWLALAALRLIDFWLGDTILTREALEGLEQELLVSHAAPLGQQSVAGWLEEHGATLGQTYLNDRLRHFGIERFSCRCVT
jgi:hypothetical protein